MKEYYNRSLRPPYFSDDEQEGIMSTLLLLQSHGHRSGIGSDRSGADGGTGGRSTTNGDGDRMGVEADAAAGSRIRRGSSFNLLSSMGSAARGENENQQNQQLPSPASASTGRHSFLLTHPLSPLRRSPLSDESLHLLDPDVVPTWRLKERMKTAGVCLVLALNIGTDPPDVNKPNPCARLQCWLDPASMSRAKARERIAERLEGQYARWQQRAKQLRYRRAVDPTVEDVKALCVAMRRQARSERILFHYNGHGVPRPTANGEIWVFDKNHTQYIPLSVTDLKQWLGRPSIVVLDCSGGGVLMPYLTAPLAGQAGGAGVDEPPSSSAAGGGGGGGGLDEAELAARTVRDTIVLCPTSENELLPLNPDYPADIFTSCLTTPIPIALRWFVHQNPLSMEHLDPQAVDAIPGKLNDRKTPLGELNWIFTAVTDTIAWNVLPSPLFQRLFRQDLLVASMFRNFLLADRILRSLNCTPVSYPPLPGGVSEHPLWQAWDLACETCLCGLIADGLLVSGGKGSEASSAADKTALSSSTAAVPPPPSSVGATGGGADGAAGKTGIMTTNYNAGVGPAQLQQKQLGNGHPAPILTRMQGQQGPTAKQPKPGQPAPDDDPAAGLSAGGGASAAAAAAAAMTTMSSAPFFAEQLTAFEIWLEFATSTRGSPHEESAVEMGPPEQLPVVLQVLLSQVHRVRALVLLRRFLDLGPWAVNLALSVGIFPYVLKLLQSPIDEYKHVLVGIWAKVIAFDPSCQVDLVKDGALPHFVNHLNWGLRRKNNSRALGGSSLGSGSDVGGLVIMRGSKEDDAEQRTMAAFILAAICLGYGQGQSGCLRLNMHGSCASLLKSVEIDGVDNNRESDPELVEKRIIAEECFPPSFRLWLCICLGNFVKDNLLTQTEAYAIGVHLRLFSRLDDDSPDVRAAACYALGCLLGSSSKQQTVSDADNGSANLAASGTAGAVAPIPGQTASQFGGLYPGRGLLQPGGAITGPPAGFAGPNPNMILPPGMNPGAMVGFAPTGGNVQWQQQQPRQHMPQVQPLIQGHHFNPQGPPYNPVPGASAAAGNLTLIPGGLPGPAGGIHPPLGTGQLSRGGPPPNNERRSSGSSQAPSVFEDRRRLDLDLFTANRLIEATRDASPTVRYEATVSLACAVGKYLPAFAAVAEEIATISSPSSSHETAGGHPRQENSTSISSPASAGALPAGGVSGAGDLSGGPKAGTSDQEGEGNDGAGDMTSVPFPPGVDRSVADKFGLVWKAFRLLQHSDPHPAVSSAANTVVSVVHEHMLTLKMQFSHERRRQQQGWRSAILPSAGGDRASSTDLQRLQGRPRSLISPGIGTPPSSGGTPQQNLVASGYGGDNSPGVPSQGSIMRNTTAPGTATGLTSGPIRRNLSDHAGPAGWGIATPGRNNNDGSDERESSASAYDPEGNDSRSLEEQFKIEYILPKSKFYQWKRREFGRPDGMPSSPNDVSFLAVDPLSPEGAVQAYRERRNLDVHERSEDLAERFASLAPQPPKPRSFGTDLYRDLNVDEEAAAELAAQEAENASKKRALHMSQSALLLNDGVEMTSMLRFHPYEPALIVCDGCDGISVWDVDHSKRISMFTNGNPKNSRMTSLSWINEMSSSLLLTGSDDGTVRIWDGLIESNGELSRENPVLSSAFFAAPDLVAGERGSGLVTEWQQFSGTLVAGGNSGWIRCWDLEAEKCRNKFECKSDTCVTTFASAWHYSPYGDVSAVEGYSGIGPDIIVAGYGDGCLKVFDIRSNQRGSALDSGNGDKGSNSPQKGRARRRGKLMHYAEHTSWIVDVSFASFDGRPEIISGCVAGDVKFWDLRASSSLRTIDVQRSPMTALAGHSTIPLLASGSHAQFIKILTLDGDTLQVIRYHEEIPGQRIGPVSCLCFHPHKPLLAAGATDEIISLYAPTQPL